MSVARPAARNLLGRSLAATSAKTPATAASSSTCHHFHSSAQLGARRRSPFRNVRAWEMGLATPQAMDRFTKKKFPDYSEEDKTLLRQKYTEEQMEALEAGEAAIDPKDLAIQGRFRADPYQLPYLEDFSTVRPVVDKRPRTRPPPSAQAMKAHFMDPDEFSSDLFRWIASFQPKDVEWRDIKDPEVLKDHVKRELQRSQMSDQELEDKIAEWSPKDVDALKYWLERSATTDNNEASQTALAPALPNKVPGVAGLYKRQEDPADQGLDPEGAYQTLKKQTGKTLRELLDLKTKKLVQRSVSNQTRLGKVRSAYVLYIAGDGNGQLGLGEAKSVEAKQAHEKAKLLAIKNMRPIPRYEDRTIFGNVSAKVGATVVELYTRPPGFGLRVSHRIFEMARAAGIHDLAARIPRSRNPMNSVKAAYQALMSQPNPEEIAIGRGKKFIDVRKVYYGGTVY